jgi:hypothetical protein
VLAATHSSPAASTFRRPTYSGTGSVPPSMKASSTAAVRR